MSSRRYLAMKEPDCDLIIDSSWVRIMSRNAGCLFHIAVMSRSYSTHLSRDGIMPEVLSCHSASTLGMDVVSYCTRVKPAVPALFTAWHGQER